MPYNYSTPKANRRGSVARDSTTRRADLVAKQAAEVVRDLSCPGACCWVDVEAVVMPPANGKYPVEFMHQGCTECDGERMVPPASSALHDRNVAILDREEPNWVPNRLVDFMTELTP